MSIQTPIFETITLQTAKGLKIVADVFGAADLPTVIMLHGGGQTRHSWHATVPKLAAAGFRVMAVDSRGHGDSDWSADGDYTTPAQAEDLLAILDIAGPRAALVGASMGGLAGFYAIGRYRPPSVRALVLVDIVISPAREGVERIRQFMRAHANGFETVDAAAAAVAAYYPERARPAGPAGLMRNLRQREGRLYWHWDPRLLSSSAENDLRRSTEWLCRSE